LNRTILLIEDNASDEKLTLLAFARSGVSSDMVVVRDGAAALAHFDAEDALPALVLLDLKLPKIDGLEVLRRLRTNEKTKTLPIVVLTASKEEEDILRSYELGANAYVRKPVEFSHFLDVAKTLGHFWLDLNEPPSRP